MRDQLTPGQARVLDVLRQRSELGEAPPTYRELCNEFGWKSTGTARDHLRALARKGYIELAKGRARQVRIAGSRNPAAQVPILGRVVAGVPIEASEEVEGMVPVPRSWTDHGHHFALFIVGDSMKDAGILNGDLAVVHATSSARDGDIVVATIQGETTIKRLSLDRKHAFLVAENAAYERISLNRKSVVLHGVVVGLLRQLTGRGLSP